MLAQKHFKEMLTGLGTKKEYQMILLRINTTKPVEGE
jgi:hypothetical protein